MRLIEFFNQDDLNTAYYDPAEDKVGVRKPSDTRKMRLFLKDLNRLKKIRALRRLERLKREDLLTIMYAPADSGMGGGMGAPPAF